MQTALYDSYTLHNLIQSEWNFFSGAYRTLKIWKLNSYIFLKDKCPCYDNITNNNYIYSTFQTSYKMFYTNNYTH